MNFQIKNRWTGNVQYECELNAEIAGKSYGLRLGFAIKSAVRAGADLSDADLSDAVLRDAVLRGANLSDANLRGAYLRGADLSGANLSDANLRGAVLRGAVLRGAVLRGAVLRGAVLRGAYLSGADLSDANLRGADLSGAEGITAPVIPNIDDTILAAIEAPGNALDMKSWHTCETTHCRAGWAVHLAGQAGKMLEDRIGSGPAGALIYYASAGYVPDFYASNSEALADLRAHASVQRGDV